MSSTFGRPPSVAHLQAIGPQLRVIPAGSLVWRIFAGGMHPTGWDTFRTWGPTASRFDHHTLPKRVQDRGIMYVAEHGATCFAEYFQATRVIDRVLDAPHLVGFETTVDLPLLDLSRNWATLAGGSQEIATGRKSLSRQWSQRIYAAFPSVYGIYYPSKMLGGTHSVALYERALAAVPATCAFLQPLTVSKPSMLRMLADAGEQTGYDIRP